MTIAAEKFSQNGNWAFVIRGDGRSKQAKRLVKFLARDYQESKIFFLNDATVTGIDSRSNSLIVPLAQLDSMNWSSPVADKICRRDYCYYSFFEKYEAFDGAWLIDEQVFINFEYASQFFNRFGNHQLDFVGARISTASPHWFWTNTMKPFYESVFSSFLALSYLSREAANVLLAESLNNTSLAEPHVPNDEVFIPTVLINRKMKCISFDLLHDGVESIYSFGLNSFDVDDINISHRDNMLYYRVVT